ncbi:MAG: hypothetical protein NVSMB57_16370 [Actinomycetota bacterium]
MGVPRRIRIFVWTFLALFFVCGFARIEAWPLTGWRLFSHIRRPIQSSWNVVTVDEHGNEYSLPGEKLGQSFRGTTHVLDEFAALPKSKQIAACDAWAEAARRFGAHVVSVRIYRIVSDVSMRDGDRGAPPRSRTLRFTCINQTVETSP